MRLLMKTEAVTIIVVLLLGLFDSVAHGLNGIRHYETLSYDPASLQQQHDGLRNKRELSGSIRLQIDAFNRTFTANLSPSNWVFAPQAKFLMGNGQPVPYDPLTFYEGVLVDDNKSSVKGHVINGVFDGVIHTHGVEYHMEKTHKFFTNEQDFHSIIYRASDVEEPESICGAKDKVYEELHKLQSTGTPTMRDRVMYGTPRRMKRQTQSRFCPVLVAADHLFQQQVGRGDPAATVSEIVTVMSDVQGIFNSTQFITNTIIQPTIARIQLLDQNAPGYRFGAASIDVNTFLDLWSQEDHSQFCLALLLTNRDFDGGVLGLAWVAEPAGGNRGGICENSPVRLQTGLRYLNTAIVTFINFGRQQPRSVSIVTVAHELGHNFGSPHDPTSGTCAPGGTQGNFIMFRSATNGEQTNNRRFSTCSLDSIRPVLESKSMICFENDRFFCGNGVQEMGEECDCGSSQECASDPCCNTNCTLTVGSECSPSSSQTCCTSNCRFRQASEVCLEESECGLAVNCTGTTGSCGVPLPKEDSVKCNNDMNLCRNGVCSGSLCLVRNLQDCECTNQAQQCHVCCIREEDGMCISTFELFSTSGGQARPSGHTCSNSQGFCDSNGECRVVDNQDVLDDLLDLLSLDTLNAIVQWLSVYWYIPVAVVVGIGILIILLQITYRRKLKKPLKRRINSMRESVRGQRARARPVSQAQTGGVGGAANAQRRRGGGPRQISQREALNRLCHFFPTADRDVVQAVMMQCSSESKAVKKLLDQGFPLKKVPIPRA